MNKNIWLKRIRNIIGILGMLLPWLALFSAGIAKHPGSGWYNSISATYYQTPALAGILTAASIVLMTYDGYEFKDSLITTITGVFGICIVLFPCTVGWIEHSKPVGFFQVPMYISNVIHDISASIFFILLSINSLFLFTKNDGEKTNRKKIRNIIYRVCGIGMVVFLINQVLKVTLNYPGYWTMINEIFMLQFFGISWLVKGGAFKFLNDKE